MLEIAAKLPPGALVGGEERLLAQALVRSGGARFVAREADLVRHEGRITAWREAKGAVEAVAAAPNIGFNFQPSSEKKTPAASGIPTVL